MKFVTSLWVACAALSSHVVVVVADDKTTQALRDMQIGMQGLMQAANDPELLAQLLQDLQVNVHVHELNNRYRFPPESILSSSTQGLA